MYKEIFELLFQTDPIFNNFFLDWIFPSLLSIFLYGFVFKIVGGMYELGLISGSKAGSFFHWFLRCGLVWVIVRILNFLKYIFFNFIFQIIITILIVLILILLITIIIRNKKYIIEKMNGCFHLLKSISGFSYFWAIVIIFIISIVSLLLSIIMFNKNQLISNIFGNIFAGLITGLIILFVTGLKSSSKIKLRSKLNLFEGLKKKINIYHQKSNKVAILISSDDVFVTNIREAFYSANEIIGEVFNFHRLDTNGKGVLWEELKKQEVFDAKVINNKWLEIREEYNDFEFYPEQINKQLKRELLNMLRDIKHDINPLYRFVKNEIDIINFKMNLMNKSLL
jgi:hypothetical protein